MKRLKVIDQDRCVGCELCMFACHRRKEGSGLGKSAIFVRSRGGMSRGFSIIVCRGCEEPPCAAVCPVDALKARKGGGVLVLNHKCIGCGLCSEACTVGAVFWDEEKNKPIICNHCGYCVQYCPHGVIAIIKEG